MHMHISQCVCVIVLFILCHRYCMIYIYIPLYRQSGKTMQVYFWKHTYAHMTHANVNDVHLCSFMHNKFLYECRKVGSWRGDWPASHSELADTGKLTQTCSERDQTPEQTVWKRRFKALLKSLDMERGTGMTEHVLIILVVLSSALLFLWCQDVPGTLQGSCKHQEKSQQERKQSEWCCCCWWWWWWW